MPTTEPDEYTGPLPEVVPRLEYVRTLVMESMRGFLRHHGFTSSAALAFFFLMSLFPFLIFLASALALLPIPHLAMRTVRLVSHFVSQQTMPMVESMLTSTMHSNKGLLSAGFILAVIAASNAFAAMATALNTIYEVKETRAFWKSRLSAISVTFIEGGMSTIALSAMLLGPHFGREMARVFNVSHLFVVIWPYMRWTLAVSCALASIELLYYLGPNRKHTLRQQFAGSVFAVVVWIISSGLLGIYLRRFAYFNAMYGTLASFIVLMIWLQFTAMAILLGAELNVQMERLKQAGALAAVPNGTAEPAMNHEAASPTAP
jgi:membrane protein